MADNPSYDKYIKWWYNHFSKSGSAEEHKSTGRQGTLGEIVPGYGETFIVTRCESGSGRGVS
jgi:hypothetical protein